MPIRTTTTDPAHDIRIRNRTEESGDGGIHTTAGELMKDMAGLNKGMPFILISLILEKQIYKDQENLVPAEQEMTHIAISCNTSLASSVRHQT
jgi:hypothetical protein